MKQGGKPVITWLISSNILALDKVEPFSNAICFLACPLIIAKLFFYAYKLQMEYED